MTFLKCVPHFSLLFYTSRWKGLSCPDFLLFHQPCLFLNQITWWLMSSSYSNDLKITDPTQTTFVISTHERIKEMSLFGFWPWKHNPQFLSSPKAFPAVNSTSESPRQLLELRINLLWGEDLRDTDGWITGVQLSGRPYLAQFNMGSNLFQLQGSKAVTLCPGEAGGFWLGAICNPSYKVNCLFLVLGSCYSLN